MTSREDYLTETVSYVRQNPSFPKKAEISVNIVSFLPCRQVEIEIENTQPNVEAHVVLSEIQLYVKSFLFN